MKSLHNFMVIMKYRTIMLDGSLFISLSQFVAIPKKLFKSVSVRKSHLKLAQLLLPKTHTKYQKIKYLSLQL